MRLVSALPGYDPRLTNGPVARIEPRFGTMSRRVRDGIASLAHPRSRGVTASQPSLAAFRLTAERRPAGTENGPPEDITRRPRDRESVSEDMHTLRT